VNDSGGGGNAGVSPAPPVTGRLPSSFSFSSSFRSSGSSVGEGSDLRSRPLDPRRLAVPDIDYIAFRCRSTDYHPQENKEIRISGSKDPVRPPDLNNSVKSLQ
jgi:hypothetical protein